MFGAQEIKFNENTIEFNQIAPQINEEGILKDSVDNSVLIDTENGTIKAKFDLNGLVVESLTVNNIKGDTATYKVGNFENVNQKI